MRIGSKWYGIEIICRGGHLGIGWWKPIHNDKVPAADLARVRAFGFARRTVKHGCVSHITEIIKPEKSPAKT